MRRLGVPIVVLGLLLALFPVGASATVHEIVGQWCAGRGELFPPGITGGSNANNFARPLFAMGFVSVVAPFDPDGPGGMDPGILLAFDFDHPASKVVGLGEYVNISGDPAGPPVYIELFELDTGHGFTNCQRLRS